MTITKELCTVLIYDGAYRAPMQMNHNLSETDGLSITYLHGDKFFRRLGGLSTHLPRLNDTHDHLASPLDSFEGRRCRSVMIVFDSLDLLEDLRADPAHLQR